MIADVLSQPYLIYVACIVCLAGLVRGFAGFGTGLIVLPLAGIVMEPVDILAMIFMLDMVGSASILPRAIRDAQFAQLRWLVVGMIVALPIGVGLLVHMDPKVFQWGVSLIALSLVIILISGWRHHVHVGPVGLTGVGAVSGFLGGFIGMPGPPVILMYLSGQTRPAQVRANIMLYVFAFILCMAALFYLRGLFTHINVGVGLLMALPYAIANKAGEWMFNPEKERIYRLAAYGIVFASGLISLPIWR